MVNKFFILAQPNINNLLDSERLHDDISWQIKIIKSFLKKKAQNTTDIQIIYHDNPGSELMAQKVSANLNTVFPIKPVSQLFTIQSQLDSKRLYLDKWPIFGSPRMSEKNRNILIEQIRHGIFELIHSQSETIIIIGTREYFNKEWPYYPKPFIISGLDGDSDEPVELCLAPIIIDRRHKKIHRF